MGKRQRLRHRVQKSQAGTQEPKKRNTALICVVLAVVTIVAYWPVLGADFVNYDDNVYVTENQHVLGGLTLDSVKWAFKMDEDTANWHPLTFLSHMLDCELFGQNAGLHHLTNLIIHTTSAVLLLLVLASMTGNLWPSAFVAAAFALHPLHVESVAWIAERKDVLSGLFWVLTMACYLRYTRTGGRGSYSLALVVFGLGLMAKPMLVTLPFVLLLLDYWPLNRFESEPVLNRYQKVRSLIVEKTPFFVLMGASCVVTYMAQKAGGAVADTEVLLLGDRLSNALVSYVAYISKMVWPVGLAVFYPFKLIPPWQAFGALLVLAIISSTAIFWLRQKRYCVVGWLWYLGTLVPVIGFVHVGIQSHADRYSYIPLIGLFMIAAWGVADYCRSRPALPIISRVAAILLLTGMFAGTRNQVSYWQDSITLFERAVEVTENNNTMRSNLGAELAKKGRLEEAIDHYRQALKISPDFAGVHNNLGLALVETGEMDEAIFHYRRALRTDPKNAEVHDNLGVALAEKGQLDQAIDHYRRSLQINPQNANVHNNLGFLFARRGQLDEAIEHYRRAVQIDPDFAKAHNNLGFELSKRGQLDEAVHHYHQAIKVRPRDSAAMNNLAWILATAGDSMLRDPEEAVRLAEKACDLTGHKNTVFLNTLSVAYFSANRFDAAVTTSEKALKLAEAAGNENLAQKIRGRLELFKEGRSHIEKPLTKDKIPE